MRPRLNSRHVLMILVVGAVLTFQNCADPGNSTFSDGSSSTGTSFTSGLPFAYNSKIDTISYMSCSGIKDAVEPRAYYTFRAGAYNSQTGGLSLTPEFLSATTHFSHTQKAQAFANSDANSGTLLNMSIRLAGNFQSVWSSGTLASGKDIDSFLPELDSDNIAGPLADTTGQQINYFPGSGNKRLMEASLRFYDFENVMQTTRNNLNSHSALLAVGYSQTADAMDTNLRGPDSTKLTSSVYGTGYFLHFSLPKNYASGDIRALSSTGGVEEINLQTGAFQPSNWSCSTNYQFMVVRPEDQKAGLVTCSATVDRYDPATVGSTDPNNPDQRAALQAIRRVLRVEDWYVDVAHHCVMPKGTGDFCYGDIGTRTVQYGSSACMDSNTSVCPHVVSVCLRQ